MNASKPPSVAPSTAPGTGPGKGRGKDTLRAFHEEGRIQTTYDLRLLRRIMPFLRPHRSWFGVSMGLLLVTAALGLVRPILMGHVAAHAAQKNSEGLLTDGASLAALVVIAQLIAFVQMYSMQTAGARTMADLRRAIFEHIQRLRLRYFDRTPIGRVVTRATNDVDGLSELFASGAFNALGDLIALLGIVTVMIALDWRMSCIAFVAAPAVGALVLSMRSRSREAYRAIRLRTARLNAFLNEQVTGVAVVQAFGRETMAAAEFDDINSAYRDANKAAVFYEAVLDAAIEMVGTLCIASVLWWSGLQHALEKAGVVGVTFDKVVVFTQYIRQFFEPMSLLSQRFTVLQSALTGAERIFELLDEPDVEAAVAPADAGVGTGGAGAAPSAVAAVGTGGAAEEAVGFDHVSHAYKAGQPVLRDVSFSAHTGERVALVGATGAGKSTVASLLLRLYEHDEGVIRVFGKDVRAYAPNDLRRLFSVVPQDVYLFSGTVLSNVGISDREPDRAKVEQALRRIDAWEMFQRREGGLDARVDERGANFSAGERQLLAFARAVYKDAPILLLDEATASVDSDTEAHLHHAMEAVMSGRTALVIAHRLSTIRAANRILVFHKGVIAEAGKHEELLAKGGLYARLHRLQFAHDEGGTLSDGRFSSAPPPPVVDSAR